MAGRRGSCVQCDTGCGFLARTAVSPLLDLSSVPALEIPAQASSLLVSDSTSEWALHLSPSAELIHFLVQPIQIWVCKAPDV